MIVTDVLAVTAECIQILPTVIPRGGVGKTVELNCSAEILRKLTAHFPRSIIAAASEKSLFTFFVGAVSD